MTQSQQQSRAPHATTLDELALQYRREAARPAGRALGEAAHLELEARIQVDAESFTAIYEGLVREFEPAGVEQVVSTVSADAAPAPGTPRGAARRRDMFFEPGDLKARRAQSLVKTQLLPPYRAPAGAGLAWSVALSAEQPVEQRAVLDDNAEVRIKSRASFRHHDWRVDATLVRSLRGAAAKAHVPAAIREQFGGAPLTPTTLLARRGAAEAALYSYEVEVEYVGVTADALRAADIVEAVHAVLRLANPEFVQEAALQAAVYRAAQWLIAAPSYLQRFEHELGLKSLLPQARAITRADYREIYPPRGLWLTDKADGKRALALVREGRGLVVADRLLDDFTPGPPDPRRDADTLVDGELVDNGGGESIFYAFDVAVLSGTDISALGFEERVGHLAAAVEVLRSAGMPAEAKPYRELPGLEAGVDGLRAAILELADRERPYHADGLIFVEPGQSFIDTVSYKWKPAEENTIDFFARRAPPGVLGRRPFEARPGHTLYFLFVGINPRLYGALGLQRCPGYAEIFGGGSDRGNGDRGGDRGGAEAYFPIQFAPSDAPLAYLYWHSDASPHGNIDGRIVEARCPGGCLAAGGGAALVDWEVVRVRDDRQRELARARYYGNDFYFAELTWLNYVDPFPREQLWDGPGSDYFTRAKSSAYHAQTATTSFMKTRLIAELRCADWVVDIGAGKGQDLGRYFEAEVRHLVAVDRDRAALAELVRRRYSFAREAPRRGARQAAGANAALAARPVATANASRPVAAPTRVHVVLADASAPYAEIAQRIGGVGLPPGGVDALVCNLAVHYLCGTTEGVMNFVSLCQLLVRDGGRVVLTAMSGEAVHELFTRGGVGLGETWDVTENGTRKYSLRRQYSSGALEAAGQQIGVLLPFSDGQYYEEWLVNTDAMIAAMAKRGFRCDAVRRASDYIPEFAEKNRVITDALTPGDKEYLGLYCSMTFTCKRR